MVKEFHFSPMDWTLSRETNMSSFFESSSIKAVFASLSSLSGKSAIMARTCLATPLAVFGLFPFWKGGLPELELLER